MHVAGIRIVHLALLTMKTEICHGNGSAVLKSHIRSSAYTCIAHPEMAQTKLEATHSDLSEGWGGGEGVVQEEFPLAAGKTGASA